MLKKYTYILPVILMSLLCSCFGNPTGLSPEERYAVDTIYSRQFNDLKTEADSLCIILSDTIYIKVVDSLTEGYMKELEYLLKDKITEE